MRKAIVFTALCLLITNGSGKDLGWLVKGPYQVQRNQTQVMYSQTYNPTGKERHCSPVGTYATEFGLATAGSLCAFIGGYTVGCWWEEEGGGEAVHPFYVVLGIYGITCPFLTAGGACLGGRICEQKGSYWRTVLGSFVGEAAGLGAGLWYKNFAYEKHHGFTPADFLVFKLCLVIPPALGATITYNLWR